MLNLVVLKVTGLNGSSPICVIISVLKPEAISELFYYRPRWFQEVEAPRFEDNWHKKVLRLSALLTGIAFTPQEIFMVPISVGC